MRTAFARYAETYAASSIRLVELERIVHLPIHLRSHRGESDAADRMPQNRQDAAQFTARRRGDRTAQLPTR